MVLLSLKGIELSYGSVQVLRGLDLEISAGEIVAFLGANGAGKSSLMNIISGKIERTAGLFAWNDQPVQRLSSQGAMKLGIEMVQQDLGLIPECTATENIMLGREIRNRWGFLDLNANNRAAKEALQIFGHDIPLDVPVKNLSPSKQQMIALARALKERPKLLILDEPTSMITDDDVSHLMATIRTLRDQGVAILFITHKFGEVYQLADRAVVMRDGVVAGSAMTSDLDDSTIIRWMVGESLEHSIIGGARTPRIHSGEVLLRTTDLTTRDVKNLSIELQRGEILGLIGLVGGGRSEILRAIAGIDPREGGSITIDGSVLAKETVKDHMDAGILLLPEDRAHEGLFLDEGLGFNVLVYNLERYSEYGFLNPSSERRAFYEAQSVNPAKADFYWQHARTLSGGNQQRLLLAKTMLRSAKVLLLDELSAGVDVQTRSESLNRIRAIADQGTGVIFASSHWEEVMDIADRVCVVSGRRIVGSFGYAEGNKEEFMKLIVRAMSEEVQ